MAPRSDCLVIWFGYATGPRTRDVTQQGSGTGNACFRGIVVFLRFSSPQCRDHVSADVLHRRVAPSVLT
jgi:hypothetical protein